MMLFRTLRNADSSGMTTTIRPAHQSRTQTPETPTMSTKLKIALTPGDGIGPEIMEAVLHIFTAAGVMNQIEFIPAEMGEREFARGNSTGISDEAVSIVEQTGLLFKGPMGTHAQVGIRGPVDRGSVRPCQVVAGLRGMGQRDLVVQVDRVHPRGDRVVARVHPAWGQRRTDGQRQVDFGVGAGVDGVRCGHAHSVGRRAGFL